MKTTILNIISCSDLGFISEKQMNYTYAFYQLHKHNDKIESNGYAEKLKKKYNLTEIEFRSLVSDVKTKIVQTTTNKQGLEEEFMSAICDLEKLNSFKKSIKNTRKKFKLNKIKRIEKSLKSDITFGGKQNLRDLTKLYNAIFSIENNPKISDEEKLNLLFENQFKIDEKTQAWKENRLLHFYILGEANQKGNRFFTFDFENNTIIYKPFLGKKIEIKFSCGKKQKNELLKLKELIDKKEISITVQVSEKQVCVSFDNEIISGFYVDEKERRKEVAEINKKDVSKEDKKELIRLVYLKHYENLRSKKLVGKISERYAAVDLNPDYIGYCIADKGVDGIDKIIEKGVINLSNLNEKLELSSDNFSTLKQNNKRKFEIQNAWKSIFKIVNHYKCAYFVGEDIDNIGKNKAFEIKESNRKVKNVWHRTITNWQIEKRCIESGIELVKIIPVYTSFIGNLMYDYFDATNAAIEICRRGMFKFIKGLFYPQITGTISDTMSRKFIQQKIELNLRDAQIFKDCTKWDKLFKIASHNGLRWRWGWDDLKKSYSSFSLNNMKSKVQIIRFYDRLSLTI
jgi:hypothetical protein